MPAQRRCARTPRSRRMRIQMRPQAKTAAPVNAAAATSSNQSTPEIWTLLSRHNERSRGRTKTRASKSNSRPTRRTRRVVASATHFVAKRTRRSGIVSVKPTARRFGGGRLPLDDADGNSLATGANAERPEPVGDEAERRHEQD